MPLTASLPLDIAFPTPLTIGFLGPIKKYFIYRTQRHEIAMAEMSALSTHPRVIFFILSKLLEMPCDTDEPLHVNREKNGMIDININRFIKLAIFTHILETTSLPPDTAPDMAFPTPLTIGFLSITTKQINFQWQKEFKETQKLHCLPKGHILRLIQTIGDPLWHWRSTVNKNIFRNRFIFNISRNFSENSHIRNNILSIRYGISDTSQYWDPINKQQ